MASRGTQPGKDLGQLEVNTGGLTSWFAELKRRRVFRTLVAYGIAAFALLQIVEPIMHGLHWPESVLSYVVTALAAGFPIVIALAWVFDIRGGRIERTAPAPAAPGPKGVRLSATHMQYPGGAPRPNASSRSSKNAPNACTSPPRRVGSSTLGWGTRSKHSRGSTDRTRSGIGGCAS